ncbi:MAG: GNAT family N-acetyltransferase [Verrucomicrobiota bacterium]|nr:GNAT family N-acetyltransferase [Verrucomicrobiota bacterium]
MSIDQSEKCRLKGRKIFLRSPINEDCSEFLTLIKKSTPIYSALNCPIKRKGQFEDYLQRCLADDYFGFLICRNEDNIILGNINLFNIVKRRLQNACIGYYVGVEYARKGYATEALQLVVRFAFQNLKLHRIEANIQPQNTASLSLIKRCGFSCEGYSPRYLKIGAKWCDHERWAILREDWGKICRK